MTLPRRQFLQLLGSAAGAAGLEGCRVGSEWRVELALRGPGLESEVQTVCGLCESACAVTVRLVDGKPVGLKGNPRSPLNRGGLCPVGLSSLEVLYAPHRLRNPLRRLPEGDLQDASWEEVLKEISSRLGELRAAERGSSVALLSGDGGSLYQDLAERFAEALGSPNFARIDGTGNLAYRLTQGIDAAPGLDLSRSDLVLSFGFDIYEDGPAPVHAIAAMVGSRPTEERAALIHVGTRLSQTAAKAEQHVAILPGTHAAFALGVAHVLVREGIYDEAFVKEHTFGFEDWTDETGRQRLGFRRLLLERYYPDRAAQLCGCDPAALLSVARRFSRAGAPLAVAGGEAVYGSNATWTSIAAHALNALRGVFDRPGGVVLPPPIPLTPLESLPTSLSDEEPSMFAAENGPAGLGVDVVEALSAGVLEGSHPIEVLIVQGCNPVLTSPLGDRFREALRRIPMVVALAPFRDDTAGMADFLLPTHVPLESWQGFTTPSGVGFSTVSLSKPVVEPLSDTRHPGDVLIELAHQLGSPVSDALPWDSYAGYLKDRIQGLALSGQGSVVSGSFEESWVHFLEERGWRFLEGSDPATFWSDLTREAGWWNPVHTSGDWRRFFRTPSGRYEFFSRTLERRLRELGAGVGLDDSVSDEEALQRGVAALGLQADGDEACLPHYEAPRSEGEGELTLVPFRPITARGQLGVVSPMLLEMFGYSVLSGWHTWIELAPETAEELDLNDGDRVAMQSDRAQIEATVKVKHGATPGVAHVPLGLGTEATTSSTGSRIGANPVDLLLSVPDVLSGSFSLTSTRVRLRLLRRRPHGGPAPVQEGFS